jgi:chromosome segregation ATPase
MQVGLIEAARLTGKDPSTITRAVNNGKLSASQDGDGKRVFDVAELERAFGPLKVNGEAAHGATALPSTDTHRLELEAAQGREQLLKEHIRLLEAQIEDLKADRAKWQEQAGSITRLLTDERSATEKAQAALVAAREEQARAQALLAQQEEKKRRWWRRG